MTTAQTLRSVGAALGAVPFIVLSIVALALRAAVARRRDDDDGTL